MNKVRKVEAAVRARESSDGKPRSSDGAHRLARVTTDLELGTIASASYSQGQQGSTSFGSLISVLDEGISVQSAAFAALPAALQREESEKPSPNYNMVEPECFVLDATLAPNHVSTLVAPGTERTCVRLDRPPSREDTHRDLYRLLAEEEQYKKSREEIRTNYGDHVANCMTSPVEHELARTKWLYEQYRTGDHPCIRADCMCSKSLFGTYNTFCGPDCEAGYPCKEDMACRKLDDDLVDHNPVAEPLTTPRLTSTPGQDWSGDMTELSAFP